MCSNPNCIYSDPQTVETNCVSTLNLSLTILKESLKQFSFSSSTTLLQGMRIKTERVEKLAKLYTHQNQKRKCE